MPAKRALLGLLTLCSFIILSVIVAAQAGDSPQPEGELRPEEKAQRREDIRQEMTQAYRAQFADATLADFSVVYLVSESGINKDNLAAPDRMTTHIPNLRLAHSWEQVQDIEQGHGIDAVLVHASALPWTDAAWIQQAYRRGTGILSIGLTFEEHQQLTGDLCTTPKRGAPATNTLTRARMLDQATVLATVWVLAGSELTDDEKALIYDAELSQCEDRPELGEEKRWSIYSAYQIYDIVSDDDFDGLEQRLIGVALAREVISGEEALDMEIEERYRREGLS
jgi:hypothetical protein